VQPLARRLGRDKAGNRAAIVGPLVLTVGLVLAAETARVRVMWLLLPCAIVLGAAYGLCLVAGLIEVQRIAPRCALAGLTAIYYSLTYLGFAAPYLLALGSKVAGYGVALTAAAGLALGSTAIVGKHATSAEVGRQLRERGAT
jgi:hypothetical protein